MIGLKLKSNNKTMHTLISIKDFHIVDAKHLS